MKIKPVIELQIRLLPFKQLTLQISIFFWGGSLGEIEIYTLLLYTHGSEIHTCTNAQTGRTHMHQCMERCQSEGAAS